MSFRSDERGVSAVIGALFILLFAVIGLSIYQVEVVPVENQQVEFEHNQGVQDDMTEARSAIVQASYPQQSGVVSIQLGTQYPPRVLGINPPPSSGQLATTSPEELAVSSISTGNVCPGSTDNTRALVYSPNYYETNAPATIYENSFTYNQQNGGEALLTGAALYFSASDNDGTINLIALQNEFSQSRTGSVSVQFVPGTTKRTSGVTDPTVTLPTQAENRGTWEQIVDDNPDASVDSFTPDDQVTLSFTGTYDVLCTPVGVERAPPSGPAELGAPSSGDGGDGGDPLPEGEEAFNDTNGNGEYDSGETTYSKSDLEDGFDDDSVALVVKSEIGTLNIGDNEIKAKSIKLGVNINNDGKKIELEAEETIDISGQTLRTRGEDIEIKAGESGSGRLLASGATIDTNQDVKLESNGDMLLENADITAGNGKDAEADLGTDDATLFVNGLKISDKNDELTYEPGGVTVSGDPAEGSVSS